MKHAIIRFATERPRFVYAFVVLLTIVFGALLTQIRIDTDPENMLPADQADRVFHNQVEDRFVLHDALVVGIVNQQHPDGIYNVQSLSALHRLSNEILQLEGVIQPDLMSLAVADNISQQGPGTIRFEWMMREAPVTADQVAAIRAKVERLPLLMDTLVSGDGKAVAIYVPIASKDLSYPLSVKIHALTADLQSDDEYYITGLPVAEDTFGHDMFVQMGISAPLAGLMIFLLMLYFFRSPALVVAPMMVAMATVIISMGLLIGMGFPVHIMSSMIPIFLMPIAVVDSVHIMSEFADNYTQESDAKEVITKVLNQLFKPMLFTSLTSAAGFLSLLLTPIPPVQVFGVFVAIGILVAFLLTILLLPAYLVRMNPATLARLPSAQQTQPNDTMLARLLRRTGRFSFARGKILTGFALALIALSVVGIFKIQINDNPVRWFKENHPIRVADRVLNEHFAGTYDAFVVLSHIDDAPLTEFREQAKQLLVKAFPGNSNTPLVADVRQAIQATAKDIGRYYGDIIAIVDDALFEVNDAVGNEDLTNLMLLAEVAQLNSKYFQRPDMLAHITGIQEALLKSELVGKVNTLSDVVKVVHRELQGGDIADYRIPDKVEAVAQVLLQYQSSHRPQDLWHMVTPDFTSSAIWLQLKSGDNQDMSAVMRQLDVYLQTHPLPDDVELRWAGKTYINVVWQDAMVKGMLKSLLGALLVVSLMMALLFRSVRLALLAMVPLSVTIVGAYGAIGWFGKDYDMPIAVLSSLALGLSVDFAIHFIERTRALLRSSGSFAIAGMKLFEEPARAIARNAIVIAIGFTPLFFAPLMPYITVGAFMAAIMGLSAISTLLLMPALMSWAGPWLFPEARKNDAFHQNSTMAGSA